MDEALKQSIEKHIVKLPDILSCRLKLNQQQIVEIHVLSTFGRNPKQISRDIQSLCIAAYDIEIDRKIISVAQTYSDEQYISSRVLFKEVSHHVKESHVSEIRVTIAFSDEEKTGLVTGVNSKSNNNRMVVAATIQALSEIFKLSSQLVLEEVRVVEISGEEAVLVAICVMNGFDEEIVVGTALVKRSLNETIVRATLDALNRKIFQLEAK
jgi:hypothetical protein